ncbi:MAG: hypothetical protein ABSC47_00165 [Terracidiphilus sp.]|jgi:hypothetical protein
MYKYTTEDAQAIRRAIQAGDLHRAIQLHRAIFPPADSKVIHETDEGDLQDFLYTPLPVFSFCSDEELRELRLRMATAICLCIRADRAIIPDAVLPWPHRMSPKAAAQNFFNAIATHRNVSYWLRKGLVQTAKILNSIDGPCSACLEAAQEYDILQLPSLPLHNCKNLNTIGCRCVASIGKLRDYHYLLNKGAGSK